MGNRPESGAAGASAELRDAEVFVDLSDRAIAPTVDLRLRRWSEWMPTVSVVIPTLNEAENLPHVLPRVPEWVSEVIIVDGRSADRTVDIALELCPDAVVIEQTGFGKGDAMRLGFEAATGDIIASLDADGSMDPTELHAFVAQLVAGADLVKGSRFVQGGGTKDMELHRKLGNLGLVWLTRLLYGQRFSDLCYGYIAFWRSSLQCVIPDSNGFEVEALINARALKARLSIAEVPSFEARRINGVSNLRTFRDGWRVLRTLIVERFRRHLPGEAN